jgi:hypothetical protein
MLIVGAVLLAGVAATSAAAPAAPNLYRIELAGGGAVWAKDAPMQSGTLVTFHRYPDGVLVSIRRSDLVRVAITKPAPSVARGLVAGGAIDIGITGTGGGSSSAIGKAGAGAPKRATGAVPKSNPALGETKEGTALFNPDRAYRPDWDSRQVPGLNLGNPNSPNDYREGKTLAYPSAAGSVAAPGDLPRAKVETGDPPKGPQ